MSGELAPARRRRRNTLLLAGLVPSLCGLVVAAVLLLMVARNAAGLAAINEGDGEAAARHFAANRWFGSVERWVAPYNEGVATFLDDRPADAIDDFTAALDLAPPDRECLVLHDIAVSWERLGDQSVDGGDDRAALDGYRRGRAALASADCLRREDAGADLAAESVALDDRLRSKILALLEEQEQRERARMTDQERERADRLEEADARAQQRDQQRDQEPPPPDPTVEPEEDYAW